MSNKCLNCQKDFEITADDLAFYKQIDVPSPTWCPTCRLIRRLAHRNERSLYKRKCDLCQADIISMYNPNGGFTTYCAACWHSDKWDPMKYARDYDFDKSFFEQFIELQKSFPQLALLQSNSVDSPWVNYETDDKNCYLNIGGHENEDSGFNQYLLRSRDCLDNFWLFSSDFCYELILGEQNYQTMNSIFCYSCRDTYFSLDCRNCSNVIGCSNLRNKQYHVFNKPVSKEEYQKFFDEYLGGSHTKREELRKKAQKFWQTQPQRANYIQQSVDCSGDLIVESKNCHGALMTEKTEDSAHTLYVLDIQTCHDTTSVWNAHHCYEYIAGLHASNVLFSKAVWDESHDFTYSSFMFSSSNCFGCLGMKKKQYCILNKQYSKEEYHEMVEKIKKQMNKKPYLDRTGKEYKYGEFFPPEASPFDYTDSVAHEWFPKNETEIKAGGWNPDTKNKENIYEFSDYEIPDKIQDVQDDILEKTLKCEESGKAYRIIKMELDFYRRFNIPIPRISPFERHKKRLAFITARQKSLDRKCEACDKEITSVYTEEEFSKVYCEGCYKKNVY